MLRINRTYSKWSVWLLCTALLSMGIINYLFFSGEDILFYEPFLFNVFLLFIIGVEVIAVLNQNRILKVISYLLTAGLCGFIFIATLLHLPLLFFVVALAKREWIPLEYIVLLLCCGILAFSAAVSLLKLYAGK